MLLDILLVVLLVMVISGLGFGWSSGAALPASPLGLILIIILVLLIVGLIGPHFWAYP